MRLEEKLDLYMQEMRVDESWVKDVVSSLKRFDPRKAKSAFKESWNKLKEIVKDQGKEDEFLRIISKHLNVRASSLEQLEKKKVSESQYLGEDFKHYWEWVKDNAFPTLLIFPGLQIFFELDSLIDNPGDVDIKRIIIYAVFWLIVATGSHITQWNKWRKENPEQYSDEGEPGPFSIKRLKKGKK